MTYPVTRPRRYSMEPITAASNNVAPFAALSDDELVQKVKTLAACDRRASVALIRSLIEFDALERGDTDTHCCSPARAAFDAGKSRRGAGGRTSQEQAGDSGADCVIEPASGGCDHHPASGPATIERKFTASAYWLQVTLRRETHDKLRRAQALARHAVPDGDVGSILDRALTLLIDHLERRRFARAAAPRTSPSDGTASGRYIPASVRRDVWQHDKGRCASRDGQAGATRPRSSSFITSRRTQPGAPPRRTTSSSAAAPFELTQ